MKNKNLYAGVAAGFVSGKVVKSFALSLVPVAAIGYCVMHAPEILAHSRYIAEKFDLYRDVCFQTEVTGLEWLDNEQQWLIRTNLDDEMKATFVVMSNGPLSTA